jgi:peptidoglycan/LPS O-acetylase OafA/YrhL
VKDMLYAVLALLSAIVAAVLFYVYTTSADNKMYLVLCIIFALLMIVFGGLFLSGRINKNEDIHITE